MALLSLLVMAVGMFIGTVIVGQLPLMVKMSQAKQKALSLYGIGLLLGAALSVVIPEGIETLYDAASEQSRAVALSLVAGFLFMCVSPLHDAALAEVR
jgi:zinc transporter 9